MYSNANGAALGPCTPAQLDVLWQSGHIGAATSFWKEGMAAWAALDALPALGARLRALTPMRPRRSKRHAPGADAPGARHTSVADAVADLEACVAAKIFKGTELSSFSDAVLHLRRARGVADAADEHRIRKLGGQFPDDTDYSVPYRET